MWHLKAYKYITNEPWKRLLSERLWELRQMSARGVKTVVYIYNQADASTFRYRAYNMCEALNTSAEWYGVYFFDSELNILKNYLSQINLLIVVRYYWNSNVQDFLEEARSQGIHVAFDCDDLVYDSKYVPLIADSIAFDIDDVKENEYWFSYTAHMRQMIFMCDSMVATNDYLKNMMEKDTGKPACTMPNFLNRLQYKASEYYCTQKQEDALKDEKTFAIGYFSGSPTHFLDFLTIAPEIAALLDDCKNMVLVIAGFMGLPDFMLKYQDAGRIRRLPFMNFIDLQKEMAQVDVNIVPLQDNIFTNCKSELKLFEGGIAGTVSVATPTYAYKSCIKNGENGYLCNPGEWYPLLRSLYENGVSACVTKKARESSVAYLPQNERGKLENMLNLLISR